MDQTATGRPTPDFSVIICTRDRADRLNRAIAAAFTAIDAVEADGLVGELVVVDNGSTDGTARLLADLREHHARLRVVEEPEPGIGRARAAGVNSARGRWLVFTDDDIVPPEPWLLALLAPLRAGVADAVTGGVVMAADLRRPWMTPDLTAKYYADVPAPPEINPGLIGANMAFRREVAERIPFDPALGTREYPGAEDVLFYVQALEAGYTLRGVADATVTHHFDPSRLSAERLVSIAEGYGRCDAYFYHHWLHASFALPSLRIFRHRLGYLVRRLSSHGDRFDERLLTLRRDLAFHREMRSLRGVPRRYDERGIGLLNDESPERSD